ncbi:MAG: hypothetical protein D6708_07960, partial [Candidatus Dadabacteria bacterium]
MGLVLLVAGTAAALPPGWQAAGRSPEARARLRAWMERLRAERLASDLVPLELRLLEEAQRAPTSEEALAWAELAAAAAPGDPRARWVLVTRPETRWAERVRHGLAALRAVVADPWVAGQLAARAALGVGLAGWATLAALLVWGAAARGRLLLHDYADAFPWRYRRWTPFGVGLFLAGAAWAAGFGPGAGLGALAAALVPYLPSRGRVLAAGAFLAAFSLPLALGLGAFDPDSSSRAWQRYLVRTGAEPGAFEPGPDADPVVRYTLAQRRGRRDEAARVAEAALARGEDPGFWHVTLGNAAYLRGRYQEAEGHYQAAAAARPDDPVPWYNLHLARLARLELRGADEALQKARSVDASAVERFEARQPPGEGDGVPAAVPVPPAWIYGPLLRPAAVPAWAGPVVGWFVWPWPAVPVWAAGLAGFVLALLAGRLAGARRSRLCPGCGVVVCPRCGYRVKGTELCAACWSLDRAEAPDPAETERVRERRRRWRRRLDRGTRLGNAVLPGWGRFLS